MTFSVWIGRFFDKLIEGLAWLAGILMMLSLMGVCVDVVLRYLFNRPIAGVLQFSEYILLYMPFLAAAYVLREDSHIKIDIILNRLDRKTQSLLNLVTSILGFFVLTILCWYGIRITVDYYLRKVPTLQYYKIPEFLVVMAIPTGCLLFAIQFGRKAFQHFRSLETIGKNE